LEHHLVKGVEHDQKTEQQSDLHLEILGQILDTLRRIESALPKANESPG
jgi:hypothetical protein